MLIKAEQKYIRTSPRKLREVAYVARKISVPSQAIAVLEQLGKRAAGPLIKTLKQAVANATNNLSRQESTLRLFSIEIGEGPTYKRGRPRARGKFGPIMKRTSHIRIILESKEPVKTEKSETKKSEKRRVYGAKS